MMKDSIMHNAFVFDENEDVYFTAVPFDIGQQQLATCREEMCKSFSPSIVYYMVKKQLLHINLVHTPTFSFHLLIRRKKKK